MSLAELNAMDPTAAAEALLRCCGSARWVKGMTAERPFDSVEQLHAAADRHWADASRADILEAFGHHPRIGADIEQLRKKFASTAQWSAGEQSSVASADESTLHALRDGNLAYEARYGHIFIVCAQGKSAAEMLEILRSRLNNDPSDELTIAAGEQRKITHLRLDKLVGA